jgi:non-specific serine/threonine protein kinase
MAQGNRTIESVELTDLPCGFGRFQLLSLLGVGGMGKVYEAEMVGPSGFRKRVALKVLHSMGGDAYETSRSDLVKEARLGALLQHPNVIDTYDLAEFDGHLTIAMEIVRGPSLRDVIKKRGALPPEATLEIGLKICAGLGHAHSLVVAGRSAGLVHRDVKPANILLGPHGELKVTDFGIALAREVAEGDTQTGTLRGSPAYMSPEQFNGEWLDCRSDLFSLGVVLYETLTGKRVFPADNIALLSTQILDADHRLEHTDVMDPVEQVLPGLVPVLKRLLRVNPEERYLDCAALEEDLVELAREFPTGAYVAAVVGEFKEHPSVAEMAAGEEQDRSPEEGPGPPPEHDEFVGRTEALRQLEDHIAGPGRLVTIRGMAGVGKTRLAQHFALRIRSAEQVQRKVFTLSCADIDGADLLVESLLVMVGKDVACDRALEDHLHTLGMALAARGDVLLVLDRFDRLVASAEPVLVPLLKQAPGLKLLVTSRERLWLDAETVLELEALSREEGVELLKKRLGDDGGSGVDPALLERVHDLLDGNPLAMELAAAQAVEQGMEAAGHRLEQWVDRLETGSTLDDALELSWSLLSPWERDALAQCSVFRGGFFLDAAAAAVDLSRHEEAPWLMDVVVALENKSLLRRSEVQGSVRFGLVESVRTFAATKLAEEVDTLSTVADRAETAAERHGRHFASFGADEVRERLQFEDGLALRFRLQADRENLVMAIEYGLATDRGEQAVAALVALVGSLGEGGVSPGRLDAAVSALLDREDLAPGWRIRLILAIGILWRRTSRVGKVLDLLLEASELAIGLEDQQLEAEVQQDLGHAHWVQRSIEEALVCFRRALALFEALDRPAEVAMCVAGIGMMLNNKGNVEQGISNMEEARRVFVELGMPGWVTMVENNLALHYFREGETDQAEVLFRRCLATDRRLGRRQGEAVVLLNLGLLHQGKLEWTESDAWYDLAFERFRAQGDVWGEGIVLSNVAATAVSRGDLDRAEGHVKGALKRHRLIANEQGLAHTLATQARLRRKQGRLEEAMLIAAEAEALYERSDDSRGYARLLCIQGEICVAMGDLSEAKAAYVRARALAASLRVRPDSDLGRTLEALKSRLKLEG